MVCDGKEFHFTPSGCSLTVNQAPQCTVTSTCAGSASPVNASCPITCEMLPAGTLQSYEACETDGKEIVQTNKIKGTFGMTAQKLPTKTVAAGAVAAAVDVDASYVTANVLPVSRRLASHATLVKFHVVYEILVPEGKTVADVISKVNEVKNGGAAQKAFTKHMKDEGGVEVDATTIKEVAAPEVIEVTMLVGTDGKLAPGGAPVAPVAPAPAPASEEGGNTAAIIGGVVGGLVGMVVIGGLLYYFFVMRKKGEA